MLLATYERATHGGGALYWVLLLFAMITVLMTAFYMFRVVFLTFAGDYRGPANPQYIKESPLTMSVPLVLLAVPSVLVGFWGAPMLGNPFGRFLEGADFHGSEMNLGLAAISTILAISGIGLAWAFYFSRRLSTEAAVARVRPVYTALYRKYWIDELYMWLIDKFIIGVSFAISWFDEHVIDGIVNGVARTLRVFGNALPRIQNALIPAYPLAVFGRLAVIAFWAVVVRVVIQ